MLDQYTPTTACPICQETQAFVLARKDGKTGKPLITIACARCGVGRIDPLPSEESLSEWYKNQYRQAYKHAVSPSARHVLRAARLAKRRWLWVRQHVNLQHGARTLDIGASSGEFVYLMKGLGYQARGLEPHLGYGGYARTNLGLDVSAGTLQESMRGLAPASQELISMFHVFEHVGDPLQILHAVHNLLVPGGYFFIEVPDAAAPCAPHTMYFAAHTLYFSRQGLLQTLEHVGFELASDHSSEDGSLLVLARKIRHVPLNNMLEKPWQNDLGLVNAQRERRWLPYLADQLAYLRPIRKIIRKYAEYRQAARHASGLAILDDVYRDINRV